MSEDNGRHVRPEDLAPHLERVALVVAPGDYDREHARGRFDAKSTPITAEGAERVVYERELNLAYARGVLAGKVAS